MSVWELTRMALAETAQPRVLAAYDCIPANRAGDPMIGLLGFLAPGDLQLVVRAADLAHRQAGTAGWDDKTHEERAHEIVHMGGWRYRSSTRADDVRRAVTAYQAAIRAERDERGAA